MMNKHPRIELQFLRIERRMNIIFDMLASVTPEQYHTHPLPSQWTLLQIANHLYLSERSSLLYLRKKMSYPDNLPPYSIFSWKTYFIVWLVLNTPKKVKAPPAIDMWTQTKILEPEALKIKWNELNHEFSAFIAGQDPKFGQHLVFNHPFAGRMTMRQMLMFFCDHMDHHIRQMKSVREKVSPDSYRE